MLNDHFRMLQAGPGSGANPSEIKESLKTGLDCLKMGLAILEVITFGNLVFLNWNIFSLQLQPEGSFESKIVAGSEHSVVELEKWVKTICEAL